MARCYFQKILKTDYSMRAQLFTLPKRSFGGKALRAFFGTPCGHFSSGLKANTFAKPISHTGQSLQLGFQGDEFFVFSIDSFGKNSFRLT